MKWLREHAATRLSEKTGLAAESLSGSFKLPDNPERGDLALPCFLIARDMKRKPNEIAAELAELFTGDALFEKVEAAGPFVNFTYATRTLAERVLAEIAERGDAYGFGVEGQGQTVVLDFSSPNIAKPIAFHHIRSTVIGNALAKLHEARGYKTVRINYLGDWGTQFGKLIVAYRRWGDDDALNRDQIRHLLAIYVRFHQEAEKEPGLEDEAREWFARMERGDDEALKLWRLFYDISLKEFDRIYKRLGVRFDLFEGESRYRDRLDAVIEQVSQRAGTLESQGALVVELGEDMPPCLLRKADGATLYATRDIAAAMDRYERFAFDRSLYVVAVQQSMHFRQFFTVLDKMGCEWASRCRHVPFGMLQLADRTMSTRKGEVIFLDDVLDKSVALSLAAIEEKNPALPNKEEVARQVGVGAIIFGDLVNRRTNDVTFEWERILNFNGETGVYVQYTHARCRAILRKAPARQNAAPDYARFTRAEERVVMKLLGQFPERIERACEDFEPSLVAQHLVDLCQAFNKVYNIEGYRFLDADQATREARLALAEAVAVVLKSGLGLLGVEAPEEM